MKPATYKKLLRDLQKLQKKLVTAYEAEVRASPERMAWVTAHWKAAEVGGRVDTYLDVVARRSAVQFILRTVYTRVLEDLGALTPPRIRGQWGLAAFKEVAPSLGLRGYLRWVFRDLAKDFPALFTPGPDELPLPGEDLVREAWELWHKEDGKGGLVYGWQADDAESGGAQFDSRFLGDLYQDLDKEVRKRFALLQTPVFVEEYILDHTLTPALAEFAPAALRDQGETFRLIDPTCGSGHFLIGAFHRLADWWQTEHGCDTWTAATWALESVWGADLNPHAVDIARFRLLLEVRERTGVTSLDKLASLPLNLAVMDSLIPWERLQRQPELFPERDRLANYATAEERSANATFLGRVFHVVVGNPPYIVPKHKKKAQDYRAFWPDSCTYEYSLVAPFIERFFSLATDSSYVGKITANTFMRRVFGQSLIQKVLPRLHVDAVIDSSLAPIPGHGYQGGIATVILFGRGPGAAKNDRVSWVVAKQGVSGAVESPSQHPAWAELAAANLERESSNQWVEVRRAKRESLYGYPWSMNSSEEKDIEDAMEISSNRPLSALVSSLGRDVIHRCPDLCEWDAASVSRYRLDGRCFHPMTVGDGARDWSASTEGLMFVPYEGRKLIPEERMKATLRFLWPFRTPLGARWISGGVRLRDKGKPYYDVPQLPFHKHETLPTLAMPFVTSHVHAAVVQKRQFYKDSLLIGVFDQKNADACWHVAGVLNSSSANFWVSLSFKATGKVRERWENWYQLDRKLTGFPMVADPGGQIDELARKTHELAGARSACLPAAILATDWTTDTLRPTLDAAKTRFTSLTHRMVALQEELDWVTYGSYGLLDDVKTVAPDAIEPLSPGHRPFEVLAARADATAPPEEKSAWWDRHGHPKVTEIPSHYGAVHRARIQARMDLIAGDDKLQLLESFPFKRRWQLPDLDKEAVKAAESWLLDRLEDLFAEGGALSEPTPYRLEEIVAAWTTDPRVAAAAGVFEGTTDVELTLVAEKLLAAESLPDNPRRLYAESGLRKLDQWKEVWALQDREDAGEDVGTIEKPPEFKRPDFVRPGFYSIRGKLNVPRERFIQFADLSPARYGWNGWRDLDRAMAQVHAYTEAEGDAYNPLPPPTHDDPRRCGVTLGLWESLDDVKRWSDDDHHAELSSLAQEGCRQDACPCAVVQRWQQWANGEFEVTSGAADEVFEVTLDDRARLTDVLKRYGAQGARAAELVQAVGWSSQRVRLVLDDLVASGNVGQSGRGARTMYALPESALPQQKLF